MVEDVKIPAEESAAKEEEVVKARWATNEAKMARKEAVIAEKEKEKENARVKLEAMGLSSKELSALFDS